MTFMLTYVRTLMILVAEHAMQYAFNKIPLLPTTYSTECSYPSFQLVKNVKLNSDASPTWLLLKSFLEKVATKPARLV